MSATAPWLALAIDWQDSPMFDDANHGERLAWVCLLCLVKAQGRAGKVRLRNKAFAQNYRLSVESVDGMLAKAASAKAVTIDGDGVVSVVNWKRYQDPKARSSSDSNHKPRRGLRNNGKRFSKTSENDATTNPAPLTTNHTTKNQPPGVQGERRKRRKSVEVSEVAIPQPLDSPEVRSALETWLAYKRERGEGYKSARFVAGLFDGYADPAVFVASVRWSMGRNYAGLVMCRETGGGLPRPPTRPLDFSAIPDDDPFNGGTR